MSRKYMERRSVVLSSEDNLDLRTCNWEMETGICRTKESIRHLLDFSSDAK